MGYGFDEPFEVRLLEDDSPDRPYFYVYTGLLESDLFNANETILIIYLIASAYDNQIDTVNTITINIDGASQALGMSRSDVCKYVKSLEKKGILFKKGPVPEDNECFDNIYDILNYISVWDCRTLDELKKETDRIKREHSM